MKARDNPFRTEQVLQLRYRPLQGAWDDLLRRLELLNYRASIVGPHGSGKTTLLEDLRPRLETLGFRIHWLRLDETNRSFPRGFLENLAPQISARDCLLLDGAEQLNWWAWRRFTNFTRAAGALIITSHRPGRLPLLIECRTTPELLRDLAAELLHTHPARVEPQARELYTRHSGNIRSALRDWYDHTAASKSKIEAENLLSIS